MKYGVIDIGSNSVRLMISDGHIAQSKSIKITKLAKGRDDKNNLSFDAMERTAVAVHFFIEKAKEENTDKIFVFATAAVRNAQNKDVFVKMIQDKIKYRVDILSGELEGIIGFLGVYGKDDGGLIDIGGASTEIAVSQNEKITYSKSIPIGAVSLTEQFKNNSKGIDSFLIKNIKNFNNVPKTFFSVVGGTATSIASVMQELEVYDAKKVDGFIIKIEELDKLINKVSKIRIEDRKNIVGLQPERGENFLYGLMILFTIMKHLGVDKVMVSEKDNLEGYLNYVTEKL